LLGFLDQRLSPSFIRKRNENQGLDWGYQFTIKELKQVQTSLRRALTTQKTTERTAKNDLSPGNKLHTSQSKETQELRIRR